MISSEPSPSAPSAEASRGRGVTAALIAYGLWGAFPLYFVALAPAGAMEILAHRILWTMATCAVVLLWRRDWEWLRDLLHHRGLAAGVALAGVLITCNWGTYVWAVRAGHTTDAALGYFLNPLVTIGLGVLVLHETLRRLQWVAVGIGLVAAVFLTVSTGTVPWTALVLAFSFGLYGLAKNRIGVSLDPWQSLGAESATLAPVALAFLVVLQIQGGSTFLAPAGVHTGLLVLSGVVTALPLLFFAEAARLIPLSLIGLIQFITPILQLIVGVAVLGESMSTSRWIGFGIVWIALIVLTVDSLIAGSAARRAARRAVDPS
ncbi:EamA family transporter RarD [Acidipropionibacterium jensenii]|uniref:EamA family transporter RarD n=1 Tax=Acidipropionibacterium jensenii TaxID=1749 RepID=UPI001FD0639D|nr:EamA family transporter RarD [Acidipropionibacterium jensenii]